MCFLSLATVPPFVFLSSRWQRESLLLKLSALSNLWKFTLCWFGAKSRHKLRIHCLCSLCRALWEPRKMSRLVSAGAFTCSSCWPLSDISPSPRRGRGKKWQPQKAAADSLRSPDILPVDSEDHCAGLRDSKGRLRGSSSVNWIPGIRLWQRGDKKVAVRNPCQRQTTSRGWPSAGAVLCFNNEADL